MLMVVMNGSQLIRMPLSKTGLAHFDGKTRQDRICLIWLTFCLYSVYIFARSFHSLYRPECSQLSAKCVLVCDHRNLTVTQSLAAYPTSAPRKCTGAGAGVGTTSISILRQVSRLMAIVLRGCQTSRKLVMLSLEYC